MEMRGYEIWGKYEMIINKECKSDNGKKRVHVSKNVKE